MFVKVWPDTTCVFAAESLVVRNRSGLAPILLQFQQTTIRDYGKERQTNYIDIHHQPTQPNKRKCLSNYYKRHFLSSYTGSYK
jgi:hypothetical protein